MLYALDAFIAPSSVLAYWMVAVLGVVVPIIFWVRKQFYGLDFEQRFRHRMGTC